VNDSFRATPFVLIAAMRLRLGHSQGGMVATGVADRAAERSTHLVYPDAFLPRDGHSLVDLTGPAAH
jgi:hypothetical protein